ncbi:glycine-rich cell wall structural protein 1.0-like [Cryptomeria japonica]|uniref:glycine-rich cell wall structural protein 1.0-like n=1 Tax=Cryptomeria japonica TaxID=3369 RepID=UPI0027DA5B7C|nr:glycine-rich cell wall structural protein 1.0-like [Cryptomeria japonica]
MLMLSRRFKPHRGWREEDKGGEEEEEEGMKHEGSNPTEDGEKRKEEKEKRKKSIPHRGWREEEGGEGEEEEEEGMKEEGCALLLGMRSLFGGASPVVGRSGPGSGGAAVGRGRRAGSYRATTRERSGGWELSGGGQGGGCMAAGCRLSRELGLQAAAMAGAGRGGGWGRGAAGKRRPKSSRAVGGCRAVGRRHFRQAGAAGSGDGSFQRRRCRRWQA